MLQSKKYSIPLVVIFAAIYTCASAQSKSSLYLFHWNPFRQVRPNIPNNKRRMKTRLECGLVFGLLKNDPHYTNSSKAKGGYTLGIKEEIPVLHTASIMIGIDFFKQGVSFNSYYFAPGYSVIYNPNEEIYHHDISINEIHIPVEYKFPFKPETKNVRTFYGMFGWAYRLMLYDNALVTNTQTGKFVFEGQNDLTYNYSLFTSTGSSIIELGLGYQRNGLRNGNAFYWELDYNYGISPINYNGNGFGSNNVNFTLGTIVIKVGLKI